VPQRDAVAFQFDVPLTGLKPGTYICQVNVIDDAGGSFSFPRMALRIQPAAPAQQLLQHQQPLPAGFNRLPAPAANRALLAEAQDVRAPGALKTRRVARTLVQLPGKLSGLRDLTKASLQAEDDGRTDKRRDSSCEYALPW
jgi:hypothetical protein